MQIANCQIANCQFIYPGVCILFYHLQGTVQYTTRWQQRTFERNASGATLAVTLSSILAYNRSTMVYANVHQGAVMTEQTKQPFLLVSLSSDADNTWPPFFLSTSPTCLGRPEPEQAGPTYLDLKLDSVSREHARIWCEADGYVLENWRGRYGIGLFERELAIGQRHELQHGYIFRIPALAEHLRIMFVANRRDTQLWPLYLEASLQKVYVFGAQLELSPQEFTLLHYLYTHRNSICPYNQILDHIWPGLRAKGLVQKGRNLDVLLANLRRALAAASGGFTFMQTVRGEGIRLVV